MGRRSFILMGREHLQSVPDEYATFLHNKDLALPKHPPYLVRLVREFLLFAQGHGGYTFEQTLHLFLAEIGGDMDVKPWWMRTAGTSPTV